MWQARECPWRAGDVSRLDGDAIAKLPNAGKINSDDKSFTEFFAPSCLDPENISKNLSFFLENRIDVNRVFTGITDPERMTRFVQGNHHLTETRL